jgi:hypothetical protein
MLVKSLIRVRAAEHDFVPDLFYLVFLVSAYQY